MKKHSDYRLIKEYPGSYKIGYILKALNGYEAGKYWINNNWFDPEDYPEYWEIVKDEIKVGDYIWRIWPSGKKTIGIACGFSNYKCDYKNTLLSFTHFWSLENYTSEGGVRKNEGYCKGDDEDDYKYELATDSEINKYLESIKPIFTTEDGIDYYNETDLVWDTHNYSSNNPAIYSNPGFLTQTEVKWAKDLKRKFFSTKEAAEKYKEENKPQYSKKDMISFSNYISYEFEGYSKRSLIEWIKNYKK